MHAYDFGADAIKSVANENLKFSGSLFSYSVAFSQINSCYYAIEPYGRSFYSLFGKNQWYLSSDNSSVNLPFSFYTQPDLISKSACSFLNTSESVSPYIGYSYNPFSLYLFGQATSTISNTIDLAYANTKLPRNEHLVVTKSSYYCIFSPLITANLPYRNMFLSLLLRTNASACCQYETISVVSPLSFFKVYP